MVKMKSTYELYSLRILIFLSAVFFLLPAWGQDNPVARVRSQAEVNSVFSYSISSSQKGEVSVDFPEGIRVLNGPMTGSSIRSSTFNGRTTTSTTYTYTYTITASEEGNYTIPGAIIKTSDGNFTSNEVTVQITKGASSNNNARPSQRQQSGGPEPIIVRLAPSKTELFKGEQLLMSNTVYWRSQIDVNSFTNTKYEGFWVEKLETERMTGFEVMNGYQYNYQVVDRNLLTAQQSGEIKIEPVVLDATSITMGWGFNRERKIVNSNSVTINVKPLPSGAPAGFSGAVGAYNLTAELNRDSVRTNNALSLIFTVRGNGALNLIDPPALNFPPDLEVFDPKRIERFKHTPAGTSGSVSFEYVIIPRHQGSYRISPIDFSFFNPELEQYVKYNSPDFNFSAFGEADSMVIEGSGISSLLRENVESIGEDILFIKTGDPQLRKINYFLIRNNLVFLIYGAGLVLIILLMIFWRRKLSRESDILYVRNKKARKLARRRLKSAHKRLLENSDDFYDEILQAFWGYLSDRMGINRSDLTKSHLNDELAGKEVDNDLIRELWEIIDECELSRYSPAGGSDKEKLYERAQNCMQKIEQKI